MKNQVLAEKILRTYLPFTSGGQKQDVKKIFAGWETVELAYGRESFAVISSDFELSNQRKPRILIPSFICRDVPDTLTQLGIEFDYYPVTKLMQPNRS
ncbi:MAG: hypothetical protein V4736_07700, partial [Bdellovibrionota bacterium]